MSAGRQRLEPGALGPVYESLLGRLEAEEFSRRLVDGDETLWPPEQAAGERLGWVGLPSKMASEVGAIESFAREARGEFDHVVLLGMGGSSLGAAVIANLLRTADAPELLVLDSTHPTAVAAHLEVLDPRRTLHIAASKSGTTLETSALLETFWERLPEGSRFAAITDPGTPLAELGRERSFRRVFDSPADVGGRFSALSPFGLVPAALVGGDVGALLEGGRSAVAEAAEATHLGALLAAAALERRNKLTLGAPPELMLFLGWLEQLVAESSGKGGRGLVPVYGEPTGAAVSGDRLRVTLTTAGDAAEEGDVVLHWTDPLDAGALGAQFQHWEIATAAACWLLEVPPFDQPDVERAKQIARDLMAGDPTEEEGIPSVGVDDGEALSTALATWLEGAAEGDYIAIQAFLPEAEEVRVTVEGLRRDLAATGLPTTLGWGPRYLHSTGQLHKGGPAGVFCLQIVDRGSDDVRIPGMGFGFRRLIDGQALGDGKALLEKGRSVLRVVIDR